MGLIYFTGDDRGVISRSNHLRGALFRNGHLPIRGVPKNLKDSDAIWFYGLAAHTPFAESMIPLMDDFKGTLVFFKNDDGVDISPDELPQHLVSKAKLFLRNQWCCDRSAIAREIAEKSGFINPLLKPMSAIGGAKIQKRRNCLAFYATMTGGSNLPNGKNARVVALEKLTEAGIDFVGGLVNSKEYHSPKHLTVRGISRRHHDRLLHNTKICLAIWGNNPLTYRLFEGLSFRCLVIAQSLGGIEFIDCGMKPGVHYVEVKPDLSDLTEKVDYYLTHERLAQEIANNGYNHFKKHFQFSGVNLPQPIFERITATWRGLIAPPTAKSILYPFRSSLLSHLKSI